MSDRLSGVWERLLNAFLGRKAVKTIDACALYFGKVVKVSGNKVDVQLDSPDIGSPVGVPLYLGLPSSSVEGIEGQRVLVGFRNGDPSQAYAIAFEFNAASSLINIGTSSPQPAARKGDKVSASTALSTWAGQVEGFINSATPGTVTPLFAAGAGLDNGLGAVNQGSAHVKIGG